RCQSKGSCAYCNEDDHTLFHVDHRLTPRRQLPPSTALRDPCSQTSKICKSLVKKITWTVLVANLERCEIVMGSSSESRVRFLLTVTIIQEIGSKTPARHLNSSVAEKFTNVKLAD
ncbi:unnamed protein product, partial [Ceratitis capitata]